MHRNLLLPLLSTSALLLSGCTAPFGDEFAGSGASDEPPASQHDGNGPETPGPSDTVDPGPSDTVDDERDAWATPQVQRNVEYIGLYGVYKLVYTREIEVMSESELTVTFHNNDSNPLVLQDWYLEALDVGTDAIANGESASVTFFVDLPPGEYPYYSSIGDHRNNGLEGTLVVTPYDQPL